MVFYEKPFLKFERLLETYVAFAPRGFQSFAMAIPLWMREKLFQKDLIRRELQSLAPDFDWQNKLLFTEHHLSHAASAFYASPFEEAAVLTMDGVGEWCTASSAVGRGKDLQIVKETAFPALARAALFRLHLLHRLQGQFRRVQADGARALWPAEIASTSFSTT